MVPDSGLLHKIHSIRIPVILKEVHWPTQRSDDERFLAGDVLWMTCAGMVKLTELDEYRSGCCWIHQTKRFGQICHRKNAILVHVLHSIRDIIWRKLAQVLHPLHLSSTNRHMNHVHYFMKDRHETDPSCG